ENLLREAIQDLGSESELPEAAGAERHVHHALGLLFVPPRDPRLQCGEPPSGWRGRLDPEPQDTRALQLGEAVHDQPLDVIELERIGHEFLYRSWAQRRICSRSSFLRSAATLSASRLISSTVRFGWALYQAAGGS